MESRLFTPIQLGGRTFENRIVISPMCQYSAQNGCMSDWHFTHLTNLAISGAGLLVIEATGITPGGRISPGCVGLYDDLCEAAAAKVINACRKLSKIRLGIQLAHAGRKGSTKAPWEGGKPLATSESAWETASASALPFGSGWPTPRELTTGDLTALVDAFASAAQRAVRLGLDEIELHAAHGYLVHQFLSPLSNQRKDQFGGSPENRRRFPLQVAAALRDAVPRGLCLGARISGSDWVIGGFEIEESIAFAHELKRIGFDFLCVSSGALVPGAKITVGPGYQVAFATRVREAVELPVRAVGMIVSPQQAEDIIASGKADLVALARAFMDNPRWVWHAAEKLGANVDVPPQYFYAQPKFWQGTKLARPD